MDDEQEFESHDYNTVLTPAHLEGDTIHLTCPYGKTLHIHRRHAGHR